uniref:Neurotoxin LmNaTx34.2 n=1 Tax=Lychas mucronatus TaxID=172552 RepID=SNAY2_LYCMC|nr:RecName: Full=Neurotoxin LmNaTx34.2; Flags: Precursor [Lychas mucronatus]
MKTLILVVIALMVIEVKSDGYLMVRAGREKGCKIWCVINNEYCDKDCKLKGGNYGYCYFWKLACYCEGLPTSSPDIWTYEKNTCST